MRPIPVPDATGPLDIFRRSVADAIEAIKQSLFATAVNRLLELSSTAVVNSTTATYAACKELTGSFRSSGGLVVVDAVITVGHDAGSGNGIILGLFVDGQVKKEGTAVLGAAGAFHLSIPLHWEDLLPAGDHKVEIKLKNPNASGTASVNVADRPASYLYAKELLFP